MHDLRLPQNKPAKCCCKVGQILKCSAGITKQGNCYKRGLYDPPGDRQFVT